MSDIAWEKSHIRSQIREQRKFITKDELEAYDKDLVAEFKAALKEDASLRKAYDKARVIAVYKAVGGELPCDALAAYFKNAGKKTVYPRVKGDDMEFVEVRNPSKDLVPGAFGIPEPAQALQPFDNEKIDIVILPGIAFDQEGNRLGQGKGYYDRWLSSFPQDKRPLLIGVCMQFQLMSEVPVISSDIPSDMILCL
ncbi:MAG: 5-formyltetrahydrofolate cyclo-ligase [Clostridiales bacterium]|nr:5-formyltetrahydrofolate cyclo-ligase [Clostridiales bacterium]